MKTIQFKVTRTEDETKIVWYVVVALLSYCYIDIPNSLFVEVCYSWIFKCLVMLTIRNCWIYLRKCKIKIKLSSAGTTKKKRKQKREDCRKKCELFFYCAPKFSVQRGRSSETVLNHLLFSRIHSGFLLQYCVAIAWYYLVAAL